MSVVPRTTLTKLGLEAAEQTMQAVIKAWEERKNKKKKLKAAEKIEIAEVTASIVQGATLDDVRRHDPAYHRLSMAVKRAPTKRAAYKEAAPKRVAVKKSAKRVGAKKSARKRR
jgi:hypothetical protein